jgi:hypothetical protein
MCSHGGLKTIKMSCCTGLYLLILWVCMKASVSHYNGLVWRSLFCYYNGQIHMPLYSEPCPMAGIGLVVLFPWNLGELLSVWLCFALRSGPGTIQSLSASGTGWISSHWYVKLCLVSVSCNSVLATLGGMLYRGSVFLLMLLS